MKNKGKLSVVAVLVLTFCLISLVAEAGTSPMPLIGNSIKNDTSSPLWSIRTMRAAALGGPVREIPMFQLTEKLPYLPENMPYLSAKMSAMTDPVLQDWLSPAGMPLPIQNFEGINNRNGVLPPDVNGDVGPNHYVQMTNLSFQIWDKNGVSLYGPANNNTLWTGFGGPCETTNHGDPVVLYDEIADRWLMSQFALPNYPSGPFYECIAISQTGDPTGAWYRYAFRVHSTKMNDYPKFGVWPDAYYMSVNQFNPGWAGAGVFAFDRSKMLSGLPATFVYFDLYPVDPNLGGMLPSDLDGPTLPPAGAPNYFVSFDDDAWGYSPDQLRIWEFHVDWATPANSTFTGPEVLATAPFDSNMCGYSRDCIPQPGVGGASYLDAISDRLMYRLQYRNFGSYETLVTNHTVDTGANHAGIRWYELNKSASWSIYQQGTYSPDSSHRWMGSIAMDKEGNIALGYSVSGIWLYPSIRYTGRLAGDPLDTLPQGEATLIAGTGSQTHTASRWGDYSMMAVDPADDCTFWYTQEYYAATSSAGWQSRIGSFKFPSCSSAPVLGPDLIVTQVDGPSSGVRGGRIPITFTIKNQGDSSTASVTGISFYLSTDTNITTSDLFLGRMTVRVLLAPGASVTKRKRGFINYNTPFGDYYIGAIVDPQDRISESDEGNNTGYDAGQITIEGSNWSPSDTIVGP